MKKENTARILLVDDCPSMYKSLIELLDFISGQEGHPYYEVATANNGLEALKIVQQSEEVFHVVITDIKMPIMDGSALLEELRLLNPKLPVVVYCISYSDIYLESLLERGAYAYLKTPFDLIEFLEMLKEVWGKYINCPIHRLS